MGNEEEEEEGDPGEAVEGGDDGVGEIDLEEEEGGEEEAATDDIW